MAPNAEVAEPAEPPNGDCAAALAALVAGLPPPKMLPAGKEAAEVGLQMA